MNSYEEVSKNGLRKVVFTEVTPKSTKCEFFEKENCLVEFTVQDNVFNLSEATLSKRKYFCLAGDFITKGIDYVTFKTLKSYTRDIIILRISKDYKIEIMSSDLAVITFTGNAHISCEIDLTSYQYKEITINDFKSNTLKEIVNTFLKVVELRRYNIFTTNAGVKLLNFTYNNITFIGTNDILKTFNSYEYLSKVDYFNTGFLFKDNAFSKDNKKLFAKYALLKRKVLVLYIEDDLSIIHRLIDIDLKQ